MPNETETILTQVMDGYSAMGLSNKDKQSIKFSVAAGMDFAQAQEIKDMLGFIEWSKNNDRPAEWIAGNLMHDLNGIALAEPGFSPRTVGYADLVAKTEDGGIHES